MYTLNLEKRLREEITKHFTFLLLKFGMINNNNNNDNDKNNNNDHVSNINYNNKINDSKNAENEKKNDHNNMFLNNINMESLNLDILLNIDDINLKSNNINKIKINAFNASMDLIKISFKEKTEWNCIDGENIRNFFKFISIYE
jgi:hypothetical protein